MNKSLDILSEQLKYRKKYLKEQEETIQNKKGHVIQLEAERDVVLIEIADMERAISFLDRVQHDT